MSFHMFFYYIYIIIRILHKAAVKLHILALFIITILIYFFFLTLLFSVSSKVYFASKFCILYKNKTNRSVAVHNVLCLYSIFFSFLLLNHFSFDFWFTNDDVGFSFIYLFFGYLEKKNLNPKVLKKASL